MMMIINCDFCYPGRFNQVILARRHQNRNLFCNLVNNSSAQPLKSIHTQSDQVTATESVNHTQFNHTTAVDVVYITTAEAVSDATQTINVIDALHSISLDDCSSVHSKHHQTSHVVPMTGGIIETPCDASPPYAYTSSSVQSHTLQQKAIATATEKISDNDIPSCCAMKLVSKEIYWDLVQHGEREGGG